MEAGTIGNGKQDSLSAASHTHNEIEQDSEVEWEHAQRSGTAVMPTCSRVKMMTRCFACSSQEFISHHGIEGAKRYLTMAKQGIL